MVTLPVGTEEGVSVSTASLTSTDATMATLQNMNYGVLGDPEGNEFCVERGELG
ncbi:hypothetical protein GCM10010305_18020 [Streptomyces termitum]|uniref:Uncharacterized protein n=1 Tax=Streptomyces termitum TaxID=67368 RepID=A0A918W8B8_9ACTN|nr:hypothetical protein GCM10010305_18020 [Streptomyces termitum]